MELELWYLIVIPIVFAAGWFARSFDQKENQSASDETKTLYKGVDLLLSNKTDQAIDSFMNLVKIDPDTIEMHFSLGTQFRRRGQFDRAIRIHNHLANRGDLAKNIHARALYELGEDYLKAGLWDRAEAKFKEVAQVESDHRIEAIRRLVFIYESEKEWQKAIDEAVVLEGVSGEMMPGRIGHLNCELAEDAQRKGDLDKANEYVQRALELDPKHKRALILSGDFKARAGDLNGAIEAWVKVGEIDSDYEALVIEKVAGALVATDQLEQTIRYLENIAEKGRNVDELTSAVSMLAKIKSPQVAIEYLQNSLRKRPSLLGFLRLLQLNHEMEPHNKEMDELAKLMKQQVDKVARYQCGKCGFATTKFQWLCPGCRPWDSMPPIRREKIGSK